MIYSVGLRPRHKKQFNLRWFFEALPQRKFESTVGRKLAGDYFGSATMPVNQASKSLVLKKDTKCFDTHG